MSEDYKLRWQYMRLDIEDAIRRFGAEDDGLSPAVLAIIVQTLQGIRDNLDRIDSCTDAEIKLMVDEYIIRKKGSTHEEYH